MANPIDIKANEPAEITLTTPKKQTITMDVSGAAGGDPYEGVYEVTPNEETQILRTAQKTAQRNIIVNPVPANYARMEWNGTTLTFY